MARSSASLPLSLPFDVWRHAWRWNEMMAASALTIGIRTAGIATGLADPSRSDARENTRMITEKMQAASLSGIAAFEALAGIQRQVTDAWLEQWQGAAKAGTGTGTALPALWLLPTALAAAGMAAAESMMSPYHSRSTANAKRLGRRIIARATPRPPGSGRRRAARG